MDKIIHAVVRLIETVSRHMLAYVLLFVTVVLGGFLYVLRDDVDELLLRFPSVITEQQHFNRSLIFNEAIREDLRSTLAKLGGDRIFVSQFQNGRFDISGLALSTVAITHAAVAPGIQFDDRMTTPLPISAYSDLLPAIWQAPTSPVCLRRNTDSVDNPILRFRLRERGAVMVFACPLVSPVGAAVGLISVEYLRDDPSRLPDEQIFAMLRDASKRIYDFLLRAQSGP